MSMQGPDCKGKTEGDDFQSALRMAQEAMSLPLCGMEQDGEEIPEPVLEPMEVAPGEMLVPVTCLKKW